VLYGADWGFSRDPTVLVRVFVHERTLYVRDEAYQVGVDINRLPAMFDLVPGARAHTIRADSARPETISYVSQRGFPNLVAAAKGPGSVEDGVAYLRQFERIVVHPSCVHWLQEARLYSFKVDRLTGDVLPEIVDAHNHCMDATRYALEPLITARRPGFLDWIAAENARDAARAGALRDRPNVVVRELTQEGHH